MGDWIDRIVVTDGIERLQQHGQKAAELSDAVAAKPEDLARLSVLIGAALGTSQADIASGALAARQAGLPYDQDRAHLFGKLIDALRESSPQNRPVANALDDRYATLPFFEAYFSNFIEGTEFQLDEAIGIIYKGLSLPGRNDDSHDLLGTFKVVNDLSEMSTTAASAADFVQQLRSRHATILAGRPNLSPGMFKQTMNRAGETHFVTPELVPGTLRAGWSRLGELDTAFERAVYMMFVISEVHPFNDGNGRVARVMMNAELVSGRQSRIIVPTVFRDDYLGGLRLLSRRDDPSVLIKALRFAHDYTSQLPFGSTEEAEDVLRQTHAFNDPQSEDRLMLPSRLRGLGG